MNKLLLIKWKDSLQPVSAWMHLSDPPELEIAKCVSVGWLISENDDVAMIAQNMADMDKDDPQASGFMRIPKVCIYERTELT